jgi:hypothetical protein
MDINYAPFIRINTYNPVKRSPIRLIPVSLTITTQRPTQAFVACYHIPNAICYVTRYRVTVTHQRAGRIALIPQSEAPGGRPAKMPLVGLNLGYNPLHNHVNICSSWRSAQNLTTHPRRVSIPALHHPRVQQAVKNAVRSRP